MLPTFLKIQGFCLKNLKNSFLNQRNCFQKFEITLEISTALLALRVLLVLSRNKKIRYLSLELFRHVHVAFVLWVEGAYCRPDRVPVESQLKLDLRVRTLGTATQFLVLQGVPPSLPRIDLEQRDADLTQELRPAMH